MAGVVGAGVVGGGVQPQAAQTSSVDLEKKDVHYQHTGTRSMVTGEILRCPLNN